MKQPRRSAARFEAKDMHWLSAALTMLMALTLAGAASAGPGTLLVGFEDEGAARRIEDAVSAAEGRVRRCSPTARLCIVDFQGEPPARVLAALPGVRWVEPDRLVEQASTPSPDDSRSGPLWPVPFEDVEGTSGCPPLWELGLVGADSVWPSADGAGAPVVAIQDSGFLASHLDLQGQLYGQHDYGDGDDVAEVQPHVVIPDHGTFIAGIVAANPENGVGRAGIAPRARLFLQRIVDSATDWWLSYAVDAMTDVADNHPEVRVVSYSMTTTYSQALEDAVAALGAADVLLVTAAGNCVGGPSCALADNDANPVYPPSFEGEHIVVVTSTDRHDRFNPWSHFGRRSVDLAAPGMDLCSLGVDSDTDTEIASGTSYAAPLVAGAAALVMETHPEMGAVEVARVLGASSRVLDELEGRARTSGRLDVAAAVSAPAPRLGWPPDLVVTGSWRHDVPVTNVGAAADATVVLFHGPGIAIEAVGAWHATPFGPGESLSSPALGDVVASRGGTLVRGGLGAHETTSIPLTFVGLSAGHTDVTIRIAALSEQGTVVGSPFGQGIEDATGLPAHPFTVEVAADAVDPEDRADAVGSVDDAAPGAGCTATAGRGSVGLPAFVAALAAVLLATRRR